MDTENSSPAFGANQFEGQTEVSAFFSTQAEADKAVAELRAAEFKGEDISIIPRSEDEDIGSVVVVSNKDRLADAATILKRCGGEVGLPSNLGEGASADDDDPDAESRIFTRGSLSGGKGAGTASGGALF